MRLFVTLALLAMAAPALAQGGPREPSPGARAAIAQFGACVARSSERKAHDALTMDFTSRSYRSALRTLADNNRDCNRGRRGFRAGGLPFAAALAEALLKQEQTPLNARLVRAAAAEPVTFTSSDRIAMCVARSDADNSAALLNADIASEAERRAAEMLGPAVSRCSPPGVALDLTPYGLRSIVATASYRLLTAAGDAQ